MMDWFRRRRHTPEDAPGVQQARAERDRAMEHANAAIRIADRVADAVLSQYAAAEDARLHPRVKRGHK